MSGSSTRTNLISLLGLVFLMAVLVLTPEARQLSARLADWIHGVKQERTETRRREKEQKPKEQEAAPERQPAAEETPELPPHVVLAPDGTFAPEPGYQWLNDDPGDKRVEWQPGTAHPDSPHVVASTEPDQWVPEAGYDWVQAKGVNDLRVAWVPGKRHPNHEHVIATEKEREWRPASGFNWANDDPADLTVVPAEPGGGS